MALQASQIANVMPADLCVTKGVLDQRWLALNRLFANTLRLGAHDRRLRVDVEYQAEGAWAGLMGAACERVTRNHGGATWVAPLCTMPSELLAWLSWHEEWRVTTGPQPYPLPRLGLPVYLRRPGGDLHPPIFPPPIPRNLHLSRETPPLSMPRAGAPP